MSAKIETHSTFSYFMSFFPQATSGVRLYHYIRYLLIPSVFFTKLATIISSTDRVADIGCGYGFISFYLHRLHSETTIIGCDIDTVRIHALQEIVRSHEIPNLQFYEKDLMKEGFDDIGNCSVAVMCDILHHIDKNSQDALLTFLSKHVPTLVIKDIDTRPRYKYRWNFFHDRIIMRNKVLCFQGSKVISRLLESCGYTIEKCPISSPFPYPHYLLIARKHV